VLEQHYTAGGFTHSYERKGFEWDVGVHYIGDVHRPHHTLRRIFDVISDGQFKWARMDAVYERIMIGRRTVDYSARVRDYIWNQVEKRIEDGNAVMAWRCNRRTRRAGSLRQRAAFDNFSNCGLSKGGDAIRLDAPVRARHPAGAARVLARAQ
jgi:hypothetical protein